MATGDAYQVHSDGGSVWDVLPRDGVKDTIDSVVIAFILAFVFRAFLVEAFIIPTGSMAPTLYGAHGTIICEDCGTEFAYGLKDSSQVTRNDVEPSHRAICPNCYHANTGLNINDMKGNYESGDRILVLKWPFDLGGSGLGASRWDVVVFKNPSNGVQNYIKRLVGLPGEVLMIVDGDVYTTPLENVSTETLDQLEGLRHEKYEFRTQGGDGRMRPVPAAVLDELSDRLAIARKSPVAQKALWFPVYDHDFPPRQPDRGQPVWDASLGGESGWDTSARRIRFEDRGNEEDYIALVGRPIRSTNAYNVQTLQTRQFFSELEPVADLRVRFVLTRRSSEGLVQLRLQKLDRVFWANIGMNGEVSLVESKDRPDASTPAMASARLAPFLPGEATEISFENVDYRIALRIGGTEVLSTSSDPGSQAYYGPDLRKLLSARRRSPTSPPVIFGRGGGFDLTHLTVHRDAYYLSPRRDKKWLSWANGCWGTAGNPILLRSRECFMLGDNSAASQDARLWNRVGPHLVDLGERFQLGTVPVDQLVGKAFFVYWPSGLRVPWLPVLDRNGFVPDVGRMRWIR